MSKKLSMSEAGKLGAAANKITQQRLRQERIDAYNLNPKLCKQCSNAITYQQKIQKNVFCSKTCRALYWGDRTRIIKDGPVKIKKNSLGYFSCSFCSTERYKSYSSQKFCNQICNRSYKHKQNLDKVLSTGIDNSSGQRIAKRYLLDTLGHCCQLCKRTEWVYDGKTYPIPLTLDHINNNPEDNRLVNLRHICANCDRLTPGFGAKNRGNGRASRRMRYANGKSF